MFRPRAYGRLRQLVRFSHGTAEPDHDPLWHHAECCAVAILLLRRRSLSPKDNQRLRWVMWGCLIGLPAFVIADLNEYTSFLTDWDGLFLPEDVVGLLHLANGVLCLFVAEAIRSPRVVSVGIPLRRVTVLALLTSLPALLIHQQAEHLHELVELPSWSWLFIGALILFAVGRLHDWPVEFADIVPMHRFHSGAFCLGIYV
jgi:hypothetical protein